MPHPRPLEVPVTEPWAESHGPAGPPEAGPAAGPPVHAGGSVAGWFGRIGVLLTLVSFAGLLRGAERGVWIDVPFVEQTRNACGAANAAMLLRYWSGQGAELTGADASLGALHERLYSAEERGALGSELANLLEESGFRTFAFEGRYEDLEEHLAKGRPLVVCFKPRGQSRLHFALAVGLDPAEDVVLLNDPARKKLSKVGRAEFLKSWAAAASWTLLAVPRETP